MYTPLQQPTCGHFLEFQNALRQRTLHLYKNTQKIESIPTKNYEITAEAATRMSITLFTCTFKRNVVEGY